MLKNYLALNLKKKAGLFRCELTSCGQFFSSQLDWESHAVNCPVKLKWKRMLTGDFAEPILYASRDSLLSTAGKWKQVTFNQWRKTVAEHNKR